MDNFLIKDKAVTIPIDQITEFVHWIQSQEKTIGFTASCFDLLHTGHTLMLREAKQICSIVVVALQTDPTVDRPEKNKPIQSFYERKIQVENNRNVDYIIEYTTEKELLFILENLNPHIRILGTDYIGKHFTGDHLPIDIYWANRDHGFSTSELRKQIFEKERIKYNV